MRGRALVLYSVCCVFWGSTWLVIKIGLEDLPPFLFAGTRMAIASMILAPLVLRAGLPRLTKAQLRWIFGIGLLQLGLSYAAVFTAERFISSGLTAMLFCSYPIWVATLAHWLIPGEKLGSNQIFAAILGIAGIVILETRGRDYFQNVNLLALPLPLASAIISALANVGQKKYLAKVPLLTNLCLQAFAGAAFLLSLHFIFESHQVASWNTRTVTALLYLAIPGTVFTFLSLFWLIPRVPMVVIGLIPLIDTVLAVALGALILKEPLGWSFVLGGLFVFVGAALASQIRPPA